MNSARSGADALWAASVSVTGAEGANACGLGSFVNSTAANRPEEGPTPVWLVLFAVGALGSSCIITQLTLLRELLEAFSGNELVLGIVLGSWLLLMGIGAWLGRFFATRHVPFTAFIVVEIAAALVPLAQVLVVRGLRNRIFNPGAEVGPAHIFLGTSCLLLPYCLLAGGALTLACALLSQQGYASAAGRVYASDSLGSILGGGVFMLLVARSVGHVPLLVFPAELNLLAASALALHRHRHWVLAVALGALLLTPVAVIAARLESASTGWQYPRQAVRASATSPYGKIVVTESAGQLNFFENAVPLISTHQVQQIEEAAHYAMAQRPNATRVLLVSGGLGGTAQEIRKYGSVRIDYAELDPTLLALGRQFLPENLAGIRVLNTDGRFYIEHAGEKYDVVILDTPDPATAQINRFYTVEFFAAVKRALSPNGVLAFGLSHYENYVSPELGRLLASARLSLATSFQNVLLLPGGRVFFLASDGPLSADVALPLQARRIETKLVNRHYLDAMLTPDRLGDVARAAAQPAEVNRDFNPVLYYYHLRHWLSQFGATAGLVPIALAIAFAMYVLCLRGPAVVLFASGFAGSALELVLLLVFQVLCGSVYHQVILIVTMFMAGLAAGAIIVTVWERRHRTTSAPVSGVAGTRYPIGLAVLAFFLAIFSAVLAPVLQLLSRLPVVSSSVMTLRVLFALLTFGLALLVGMQFPLANRRSLSTRDTARMYTADFLGAALGALMPGALLIPLLGIAGVGLLTAALNLLAGLLLFFRKATS